MSSPRHFSRVLAVQTVFVFLMRPKTNFVVSETIQYLLPELPFTLKDTSFAEILTQGALDFKPQSEELIIQYSLDHSLQKFDELTLAILLVSIFELKFSDQKQAKEITINEAIELAKDLGKDSAPSLINALLSKIANN